MSMKHFVSWETGQRTMGKIEESYRYGMRFWLICSNMLITGPKHILESRRLSGMVATLGITLL